MARQQNEWGTTLVTRGENFFAVHKQAFFDHDKIQNILKNDLQQDCQR
jgi:hypothetical protein